MDSGRLTEREHWDDFWDVQVQTFNPGKAVHVALDRLFDCVLPRDSAKLRQAPHVLELGAGGSFWLGRLARTRQCQAVGLDYSDRGCASARLNSDATGVHVIRGDVFTPPLRAGQFDLVYSLGLVEHFEDPKTVLQQAFAMLAPGGRILTTIPNKAGLAGTVESVLNAENYNKHVPWKLDGLLRAHREVGFEDIEGDYFGPYALLGRLRDDGAAWRALLRAKSLLDMLVFHPLYLRANLTASSSILSSNLAVWGRRPAADSD